MDISAPVQACSPPASFFPQTPPPAWHRLEGTKEDTESAERGERREWAQFLGTCDSMGSTSGATDSPSLGAPSPTGHPAMTALPAIPEAAGAFSATTSAASREAEGGAGGSAQGIGVAWATGPAASDVAGAHELDRTAGPGSGRGSEGEDGREGTAVLQERSAVHKELDEAPGAPAPAQVASTAWGSGPTLRSPTRYGHRLGGPWGLGAMTVEESGALQELHAAVSAAPEQQWELIRAMWEVTMATTLGGSASEEERESESGTERESEDSWWSGRERGGQCEGPKGQAGSASDDGEEAHLEGTGREGSLSRVPTGDADGTGREGMEGRDRDARDVGGEENAQGVERGWLHIPPQEVALAGEAEGGAASQDLPGGSGRSAERTADGGREGESARGGTPSGGGTMEAAGAPRGEGHLWERLEGLDDTWDGSTDAPLPELLSGGLSSGNDSASDMEDLGELRRRARVRQGAEEGATGSGRAEPGWGDAGGERSNVREMYDAGYQESEPGPAPRLESDTVAIPGPATAPYRSPLSASDSDGLVLLSSASGLVGDLGEGSQSSDRGVVLMAQAVRGSSGKGMASLNEEMAEDMVGGGDPGHSPGPDTLLVDSSEAVAKAPLNVIIPHENSPAGRGASGSPGSPSGAAEHSPAGRSNDTDVPRCESCMSAFCTARTARFLVHSF